MQRRVKPTSPLLVVPPNAPPPELDSRPLPQTPLETVRPERCGRCGGSHLLDKDTTTRKLVGWVAGYVQERVIALTRCRCGDCDKVTSPAVPGACLPKTHLTAALVAHLLHGKYTLHLALQRIRGELARQGYPMASATISDVVQRALHELRGVARTGSESSGTPGRSTPCSRRRATAGSRPGSTRNARLRSRGFTGASSCNGDNDTSLPW